MKERRENLRSSWIIYNLFHREQDELKKGEWRAGCINGYASLTCFPASTHDHQHFSVVCQAGFFLSESTVTKSFNPIELQALSSVLKLLTLISLYFPSNEPIFLVTPPPKLVLINSSPGFPKVFQSYSLNIGCFFSLICTPVFVPNHSQRNYFVCWTT